MLKSIIKTMLAVTVGAMGGIGIAVATAPILGLASSFLGFVVSLSLVNSLLYTTK